MTGFTEPQIQRLMEFGDDDRTGLDFPSDLERDSAFEREMSGLVASNEEGLRALFRDPRRNDLSEMESRIADRLVSEGFIEVRTPTIVPLSSLAKMGITRDHPLYRQMFVIDGKRCLRPMLAPNLYTVMRRLRDHTDGPVKIFEIGSCFRKESKSSRHLEEFTMMNLVELGPEGDAGGRRRGGFRRGRPSRPRPCPRHTRAVGGSGVRTRASDDAEGRQERDPQDVQEPELPGRLQDRVTA